MKVLESKHDDVVIHSSQHETALHHLQESLLSAELHLAEMTRCFAQIRQLLKSFPK